MTDIQISKPTNATPVLLIDFKKNRLRVYKNTLQMMGNPNYIQFLINPEKQSLVITPSHKDDNLAHKIRWTLIKDGQCCEFYSKHLVRTLKLSFFPQTKQSSCRFYGSFIKKHNIAYFSLNAPMPINDALEEERNLIHEHA